MEGGATRARTILSPSLSCLVNTLWACADRRCTHRCTHARSLRRHHPHFSRQAGPSVPWGRDRKTEEEISGPSNVCVIYTPTPSFLSLSLSNSLFLIFPVFIFLFPNSKLQIQHSVSSARSLVKSHTNILSIFICFILHLTQRLHPVHMALTFFFLFFFFFFLPFFFNEQEATPVTSEQSHLLLGELYIYVSCRITRSLWKCHLKNASRTSGQS